MEILPGVVRILDDCAALKSGEQVLIVTDTTFDPGLVGTFATLAAERGAEVVVVTMAPRDLPGQEPPSSVAAIMKTADLILELTSVFIGSTKARIEACAAGARYLTMPGLTPSLLVKGGAADVDFARIKPVAEQIAQRFTEAKQFTLSTGAGTSLQGSIEGRAGRVLHGLATTPGAYMAPPDIEVGLAPVEGTTEGVAVIDGALLMMSDEPLAQPVVITFEKGEAVKIEGRDAYLLHDMIDRCQDSRMYNLAEVSVGLNPQARVTGIALESEAALGTVHIALGNSIGYGGTVDAVAHLDCVMRAATLRLDDELILEDGDLLVAAIPS
jgi:leucyl aminopeptidase (aminopeptidase T)